MIMESEHNIKFMGMRTVESAGPFRWWECACGHEGFTRDLVNHLDDVLGPGDPRHDDLKPTQLEVLQEFNTALVQLRQAMIKSMPNVIRKAFRKWDSEHTP